MADLHVLEDDIAEDAVWRRDLSGLEQFLDRHRRFAEFYEARERAKG